MTSPAARGKPFALLLPAYTANKSYWRSYVDSGSPPNSAHTAYLMPPTSYEYTHPEGTGKGAPPFYSCWFLGKFPPNEALVRIYIHVLIY